MAKNRPQIVLTNDDGIQSPGLWAAAQALSRLGFVTVAAPREQSSGMGRSMPTTSDGIIRKLNVQVGEQEWEVHSIGGTPAQTILHAFLEILKEPPDLVVSGINYGENLGNGVTASGTVGAALEGASWGVPSLAVSLQTDPRYHLSYSEEIDFSTAAHFTYYFARLMLEKRLPDDVDVLKIDVPSDATPSTAWTVTRQSKHPYYRTLRPERSDWDEPIRFGYELGYTIDEITPDSDIYALQIAKTVSVTPLSLDLTSRVAMDDLDRLLRK
ncbi:MAG TPA: 5'/3'-nucleotidase SurE [Anaerolineaceae bacterium]|nr:5'/3'-nucleotidase SurE [Anaerolineaceae bacterium]